MAKKKAKSSKKKTGTVRARTPAKASARKTAKAKGSVKKKSTRKSSPSTQAKQAKTPTKQKTVKAKAASNKSGAAKSRAVKPTSKANSRSTLRAKTRSTGDNHKAVTNKTTNETPSRPRGRRLSPQDLESFRQLLLEKRAELVGDVSNLRRDALGSDRTVGDSHASNMPTHMADLGTDNWEQEFTLGLLDKDMALLKEIDGALDRISGGTYGRCMATEQMITKARLRAKPWAKYCIEYAEQLERGLVPRDED